MLATFALFAFQTDAPRVSEQDGMAQFNDVLNFLKFGIDFYPSTVDYLHSRHGRARSRDRPEES